VTDDHGSKYRVEVIGLGRQDWFSEPQSCFRSAYLICGAARFSVSPSSPLRRPGRSVVGYAGFVSPTILRVRGFRFYFFSREERRAHVHVQHADGEAKFWIDPAVELAANFSLKPKQVTEVQELIEEHLNEIRFAWAKHFPSGSH
jgi:uncharacterized protein DUF4160